MQRSPAVGPRLRGKHLSRLTVVVVDCLFPEYYQFGLSSRLISSRNMRAPVNGSRFAAVSTRMARSAPIASPVRSCCLAVIRTNRNNDDLICLAAFLDSQRLFQGDFIKRIDAHFDAICLDAGTIRLDPDTYVVIDNAFQAHKYLFQRLVSRVSQKSQIFAPAECARPGPYIVPDSIPVYKTEIIFDGLLTPPKLREDL